MKIDYTQTLPEYYFDEIEKLHSKFKVDIQITEQFIKENNLPEKVYKVGDTIPDFIWPDNPLEAFESFKEYHAKDRFLIEVAGFLDKFGTWNKKAMIEKLAEIEQFISESTKIMSETVFNKSHYCTSNVEKQKIVYQRIVQDYYNTNHIQFDYIVADTIYGKYILFKELLNEKLNPKAIILPQLSTKLTDDQRSKLFDLLKVNKFIPDTTHKESFLWALGTPDDKQPEQFKPIKWKESKQGLRELINLIIGHIGNPEERIILQLFLDKEGNPLKMYSPEKQYSSQYMVIENIIKSLNIGNIQTSSSYL